MATGRTANWVTIPQHCERPKISRTLCST